MESRAARQGALIQGSPVTGVIVGSLEMGFVLYILIAWIWGGYRDLRAEQKEKSATHH